MGAFGRGDGCKGFTAVAACGAKILFGHVQSSYLLNSDYKQTTSYKVECWLPKVDQAGKQTNVVLYGASTTR